jgi:hypothetical protein
MLICSDSSTNNYYKKGVFCLYLAKQLRRGKALAGDLCLQMDDMLQGVLV